jgi:hypothetical protein
MHGEIAITEDEVKGNLMGWDAFDFFRFKLKSFTLSPAAGWYAYKKKEGIHYFKWLVMNEDDFQLTYKYLKAHEQDGWTIGIGYAIMKENEIHQH